MNTQRNFSTLHRWALAIALALLSACGGGEGGAEGKEDGSAESGNANPAARECGGDGFPCSLNQVSLDVLERGESLADQVMALLGQGHPMAEALDFIHAQTGVADAASSHGALRFRLNGGRDVFILRPEQRPLGGAARTSASGAGAVSLADAAKAPERERPQIVVGESPTTKRALVLSPFKYYFAPDDDGASVAHLLEGTRGYAGNVTYLENATKTSATVGIQQFIGWQAFDVIHVSSHGARACDQNRCVSAILSGDIYSSAADLLRITEAGVNTARIVGSDEKLLALGPEFFKSHYPAGLDRKIIFFNACETYSAAGDGLSDVLLGKQSVFLGWTEVVQNAAAKNAALAFFQNLSVNGVTAASALDSLGDLSINRHKWYDEDLNAMLLIDRDVSSDLRLREVVTLERPGAGGVLLDNASVTAVGKAHDGVVDGVPYQVLIEGIPAIQQDAAIVKFTVNGYSSTPQAVTIGERVGDTGWRLTGQVPYIDVAPEQVVEMLATVQLPEGGVSEHRVLVTLKAVAPPAAETWVGQAVSHFDDSTPEGQVHVTRVATVTFQQVPSTIGGRYKVLRPSSGSMRWSRSGTIKTQFDGECAYSSGSVDVAVLEADGEIIIDTAAAPNTYSLSGLTKGVEVRIAQNCGSYTFSTRAGGAWAPALGQSEGFTVSADGGTIDGTTGGNHTMWEWSFRRQ